MSGTPSEAAIARVAVGDLSASRAPIGVALLLTVVLAWSFWPEPSSLGGLASLLLVAAMMAARLPRRLLVYATIAFLSSTITALFVYRATAPLGHFVTNYQEPLVADSQFFLYCAQEYSRSLSSEYLFLTWGSAAPVLWGGLSLLVFDGSYIGIILLNALAYGASIHLIEAQLGHEGGPTVAGCLSSCLPLQTFYGAMLAKEPPYLFLCAATTHLARRIARREAKLVSFALSIFLVLVLLLFRPVGSLILGVVLLVAVFHAGLRARAVVVGMVAAAATAAGIGYALAAGYRVPLFFLTEEGGIDFGAQITLVEGYADVRTALSVFAPLFTPPWSLALVPVLGAIWLVAPFPMLGSAAVAAVHIAAGTFTFQDLAQVARAVDAVAIVAVIAAIVTYRRRLAEGMAAHLVRTPILLFTALSIAGIAAFQFIESGRHRYAVTPVLVLFGLALRRRGARTALQPTLDGAHHSFPPEPRGQPVS